MFRPQIKVLDCTIRDGGLINEWNFTDDFVRAVYRALSLSGVDYMEIGYKATTKLFDGGKTGCWKFCQEEDIKRVTDGVPKTMKLSAMIDVGRIENDDIIPRGESLLDMIRVATYVQDIDKAIALVEHAHGKGYETTVNIMAVSHALDSDLDEALRQLNQCPVDVVYVVDSFGALYCEQIEYLVKKYRERLDPRIELGIHTHNNMQLAYANTIEAIIHNANYLDASIYGIGRGPGNCCLELLLAFLKNPKFELLPILDIIEKEFLPLREQIEWGYIIPYMITGMLDEHPRAAIAWRDGANKDRYAEFYNQMLETAE